MRIPEVGNMSWCNGKVAFLGWQKLLRGEPVLKGNIVKYFGERFPALEKIFPAPDFLGIIQPCWGPSKQDCEQILERMIQGTQAHWW